MGFIAQENPSAKCAGFALLSLQLVMIDGEGE